MNSTTVSANITPTPVTISTMTITPAAPVSVPSGPIFDKGLANTIVADTQMSFIDGGKGVLEYVGIEIQRRLNSMVCAARCKRSMKFLTRSTT